mmetsp:Transcript_25971/g.38165  ORF Transcript_25971/g.38165 Transcript_25971/m.38165 type:complete len:799 (+) Transcript_25971:213-2609(+)|eukprot:CAMPEP_0173069462 /NCGR_PEP_ID=MMETSP1102-20130122/8033_1 /TAXON_ID=49646 /ORGANISM="Geminigera sp., Strain Caron Lab Isolate" /LENGTH=798 /DNA_ID=CAMNT_0013937539 /DNA_START=188 /DNA_END=2584 /DNA_ORIENTATION=+
MINDHEVPVLNAEAGADDAAAALEDQVPDGTAATARGLRQEERVAREHQEERTAREAAELGRLRQDLAEARTPGQRPRREAFRVERLPDERAEAARGGGRGARQQAARRQGRDHASASGSEYSAHSAGSAMRGPRRGEGRRGPDAPQALRGGIVNAPDAAFQPSHRVLVQLQQAIREEVRLADPSRMIIGAWSGAAFTHVHTTGAHDEAARHLQEVARGLQAFNLLGLTSSIRQLAGLYVGQSMLAGPVRERWYRIFDQRNAEPFSNGFGLLLALDEWLLAYVDPRAADHMAVWLTSIAWPGGPIAAVREQIEQIFRMEATLAADTANNAPLTRYLERSAATRLQWVTRWTNLPSWIRDHLRTIEGRALQDLDQAWDIWERLQPDEERLQTTRVLPNGGRPGNRTAKTAAVVPRPVHVLSVPAPPLPVVSAQDGSASDRARQLLELVLTHIPATVPAFRLLMNDYNDFEAAGVFEHEVAEIVRNLHLPKSNLAPLHSLCTIMANRYCYRCDMTTDGPPILKDGKIYHAHLINACPFAPSPQEIANLPRNTWDTRCLGTGISNMEAHKQLVKPQRGAAFVVPTSTASTDSPAATGPYRRPGVRDSGPGLHVIQAQDTSPSALQQIQNLQSLVRYQQQQMQLGQLRFNGNIQPVVPPPIFQLGGIHQGQRGLMDLRTLNNQGQAPQWAHGEQQFSVPASDMPQFLAPEMDSAPAGSVMVGATHDNRAMWLPEADAARLHTAPSALGPVPAPWEEMGHDGRPAVLTGSAPQDYIHRGTHVDGRTPLFCNPSLELGNDQGGR